MNKIISIAVIASLGAFKFLADAPIDIVDFITILFVMLKRKGSMP